MLLHSVLDVVIFPVGAYEDLWILFYLKEWPFFYIFILTSHSSFSIFFLHSVNMKQSILLIFCSFFILLFVLNLSSPHNWCCFYSSHPLLPLYLHNWRGLTKLGFWQLSLHPYASWHPGCSCLCFNLFPSLPWSFSYTVKQTCPELVSCLQFCVQHPCFQKKGGWVDFSALLLLTPLLWRQDMPVRFIVMQQNTTVFQIQSIHLASIFNS